MISNENKDAMAAFCASKIGNVSECKVESYEFLYEEDEISVILSSQFNINVTDLQDKLLLSVYGDFLTVNIEFMGLSGSIKVIARGCIDVYEKSIYGNDDNDSSWDDDSFLGFCLNYLSKHIKEIIIIFIFISINLIYFSWDLAKELQIESQCQMDIGQQDQIKRPEIFFLLQAILIKILRIVNIL